MKTSSGRPRPTGGAGDLIAVGIVGLGPEGDRLARELAAVVAAAWEGVGTVRVVAAAAGDDPRLLARILRRWADREGFAAAFTAGRAGHLPCDFAPEATAALLDRRLPGVEERMHLGSPARPADLLFRGRAGMRRATLVVNLPERAARARAVVSFLAPVVRHAVEKARGDGRECAGAGARR